MISTVIVILGFAAIVAFLVFLQVKHFVPFDFARLRGNASPEPMPTVFNNKTAMEDGSNLSATTMAKGFALFLGLAFVFLMNALAVDLRDNRHWDHSRPGPSPYLIK